MNSSNTNEGGWKNSEIRTYVNNDVCNALPSDLQAVIKEVNKVSDNGNGDKTTLNITKDKLFLLSLEEVGFISNDVYGYNVAGQGMKYEYFTDDNSREKQYLSGELSYWWLCSARTDFTYVFFYVYSDGDWSYGSANSSFSVAPAFCI